MGFSQNIYQCGPKLGLLLVVSQKQYSMFDLAISLRQPFSSIQVRSLTQPACQRVCARRHIMHCHHGNRHCSPLFLFGQVNGDEPSEDIHDLAPQLHYLNWMLKRNPQGLVWRASVSAGLHVWSSFKPPSWATKLHSNVNRDLSKDILLDCHV